MRECYCGELCAAWARFEKDEGRAWREYAKARGKALRRYRRAWLKCRQK